MIREIINEVREAIQEAFTYSLHTNSGSFVLFLAPVIMIIALKEISLHIWSQSLPPIVLIICWTHIGTKLETTSILDISIEGIRTMISSIRAMMV